MPEIVVHSYNDSSVGHVNIEFRNNGVTEAWLGANADGWTPFGITGGVFDESAASAARIGSNPGAHTSATISVSDGNYANALSYGLTALNDQSKGSGVYDLLFGNCVDFANSVLGFANPISPNWAANNSQASNYMSLPSFATSYANAINTLATFNPFSYAYEFAVSVYQGVRSIIDQAYGIWNKVKQAVEDAFNQNVVNAGYDSPIVLDMDGNGVRSVNLNDSNVFFDIKGDGNKVHTGWVSSGDAFLAHDLNGDGKIESVNELFGGKFGEGFAKLKALDSNGDSLISSEDVAYDSLSLWSDLNQDGETQAGELASLQEMGVEQISVGNLQNLFEFQNGNLLGESSTATVRGHEVAVVDVYFRSENVQANVLLDSIAGFSANAGVSTAAADPMAKFVNPMGVESAFN